MSSTQFGWFNGCSVICPTEGTSLGFPGPILDSYSPPLQNSDTYVLHLPSRYSKTRGMKLESTLEIENENELFSSLEL